MRTGLATNPRVNNIARELEQSQEVARTLAPGFGGNMRDVVTRDVMRHVTVSSLLIVWGAANEHTSDGVFRNADLTDIDDMVGLPGFGKAMTSVGWAVYDATQATVSLPNFHEYNTCGKERSAEAKTPAQRQKDYRERQKALRDGVTKSDVTSNRREEKSREEITTPLTPQGGKKQAIAFQTFIDRCKANGEKAISEYTPVWDYARRVGLPAPFIELAWWEFARQMGPGGTGEAKRQKDWRATFRNYVEKGYLKLWILGENQQFKLTSAGQIAERANKHKETA